MTPLEQKYQYNGIELTNDFGLMINEARYRTLDPQLGRWGQIDPLAEKYYGWSGYNYVLNNPIKLLDKDGRKPDNYYRNQRGDLLAVVRTNDTQDNFYTVKNDNTVVLTHTREKDATWSRATDQEKTTIVTRIEKNKRGAGEEVNGDGLTVNQQRQAANLTTNSGGVAQGANTTVPTNNNGQTVQVFSGQANVNGQRIEGVIYSPTGDAANKGSFRVINTTDPVDPGGDSQEVPQGTLPMPQNSTSVPLPSNALPANLVKPVKNDDGNTIGYDKLTDSNGLIPKN